VKELVRASGNEVFLGKNVSGSARAGVLTRPRLVQSHHLAETRFSEARLAPNVLDKRAALLSTHSRMPARFEDHTTTMVALIAPSRRSIGTAVSSSNTLVDRSGAESGQRSFLRRALLYCKAHFRAGRRPAHSNLTFKRRIVRVREQGQARNLKIRNSTPARARVGRGRLAGTQNLRQSETGYGPPVGPGRRNLIGWSTTIVHRISTRRARPRRRMGTGDEIDRGRCPWTAAPRAA